MVARLLVLCQLKQAILVVPPTSTSLSFVLAAYSTKQGHQSIYRCSMNRAGTQSHLLEYRPTSPTVSVSPGSLSFFAKLTREKEEWYSAGIWVA